MNDSYLWGEYGLGGRTEAVEEWVEPMLMNMLATITGKMYRKSDGALLALCEVSRPNSVPLPFRSY